MEHKLALKVLAALVAICGGVLLLSLTSLTKQGEAGAEGNSLPLSAPSFVSVAHAAPAQQSIASFLDSEAGIAAYTQTLTTIDLSVVRDEFRTIERETSQYIVGSVGIPDYSEDHDPHVYVHTDGWVLAYYLADQPASHILDLRHYDGVSIESTKLENAMKEILTPIGVSSFTATYYDFRYPNATHIMLIAEAITTTVDESFDVQLPNSFTYYERSWSHALYDGYASYQESSTLYLNDVSLNHFSQYSGWEFARGALTPAQLPSGTSHTIRVSLSFASAYGEPKSLCGIALVYQEAP